METLKLLRSHLWDRTVGVIPNLAVTLELPWRNNEVNVSCIKPGLYKVRRDTTGRWQYYRVENVEGRTFIEFHPGTRPGHTEGCILVGSSLDSKFNLHGSDQTLAKMLELYPDGFMLDICEYDPILDGPMQDLLPTWYKG